MDISALLGVEKRERRALPAASCCYRTSLRLSE